MLRELLRRTGRTSAVPLPIDRGRQLFVDDYLIDFTTLNRTFHAADVSPNSPVLKPETPLELNNGVMPATALFSDGVFFDPEDYLYKMWYMAGYDDGFAYATSPDGILWTRPSLDIVAGTNRVLPLIQGYRRNGSTVWLDHEAKDRAERFKMFVYYRRTNGDWPRADPDPLPEEKERGYVYTSPDGIHWTFRSQTGPLGDVTKMFWNPFAGQWIYNVRFNHQYWGRARAYVANRDFVAGARWARADLRMLATADSRDRPDPEMQYLPELYEMDCAPYESLMIGMFGIYFGPPNPISYRDGTPKKVDLYFGFSRDGFDWKRPDRTAFLAGTGVPGEWNRGYLHAAGGLCLIVGDELRFYFTGFSGVSPVQKWGPYADARIGYATLRRDGFVSMDGPGIRMALGAMSGRAQGDERWVEAAENAGLLITRPVTFSGSALFVNASVREGGQLRIAVLDEQGDALPGLGFEDCAPLRGNSTRHRVQWAGGNSLRSLAGKPVRFAFRLDAGELYAFWVSAGDSGASNGYVAAGGPGFTGATDTTGA